MVFECKRITATDHDRILGKQIPVSNDILVEDRTTGARIGVEICEDLWVPIPVSTNLALAGANIYVIVLLRMKELRKKHIEET